MAQFNSMNMYKIFGLHDLICNSYSHDYHNNEEQIMGVLNTYFQQQNALSTGNIDIISLYLKLININLWDCTIANE